MLEENMTPEAETEYQTESFKRPSRVRKAVTSILGGLGIFAGIHAFGAVAGMHNDEVMDARAQKARLFDLSRAEVVNVINLDEDGEEIPEQGVPVAVNEK